MHPKIDHLTEQIKRQKVIPFVGAGLSKAAGLPLWEELVQDMKNELLNRACSEGDMKEEEQFLERADYLDIADCFKDKMGPRDYHNFLRERYRHPNKGPTQIHSALGRTSWPFVITTNYDKLLETTFRTLTGLDPRVVIEQEELFTALEAGEFFILKLHGDIDRPESIVLTRDEYNAFVNSDRGRVMLGFLCHQLMTRTVLFLGFGLNDPNFLRVFGEAGWLAKGYHGAVAVMADTSRPERDQWARRSLHIIPIDRHEDLLKIIREITDAPVPLEEKLAALDDRRRNAPIVCLGSVYMDLELRPVDVEEIRAQRQEEWTDVKSSLRIGGSAWYVYQYLDKLRGKTRLATRIGDESKEFFAERYIEPLRKALAPSADKPQTGTGANHNHTAMTVHLIQCKDPAEGEEPIATTMLTDTGILESLRWDDDEIQQPMRTLDDGGVLYLSGYFKTALHRGLPEKLRELDRKKVIICLDHGRFRPEIVGAEKINPLRESLKYVDIYFCTTHEMRQLFEDTLDKNPRLKRHGTPEEVLKFLDEQLGSELPEVILVRDNKGQENERLTVAIKSGQEHKYASIPVHWVQIRPERFVGVRNVFHARFLERMLNDKCEDLISAIIEWALCAQRMMEWVMSGEEPETIATKCNMCKKYAQEAQDWWANTSKPLPLFDCPNNTSGGEYANT